MRRARLLPGEGNPRQNLPMVAIVGRPNVGKSTLFNRLSGSRDAVVHDLPGVTRDRHYVECVADGRPYTLIDTGGFDPKGEDTMSSRIANHVRGALQECDLVVAVFDATAEATSQDIEVAELLRRSDKPVLYVANKADSERRQQQASSYFSLGIDGILPVSAAHNRGITELQHAIARQLPAVESPAEVLQETPERRPPRLAIVGRPNAGKSSLVNRLLGREQQIVDDRPGTTIDSIDTLVTIGKRPWIITDTAGMRRKSMVEQGVEWVAVLQAIRAMERSDVVVLMIDADAGAAEQDTKIAGLTIERGRALVIALNKTDKLNASQLRKATEKVRDVLNFAGWAPVVPISVKTGKGLDSLMEAVASCLSEYHKRVPTGALNRFFAEVLETHPPPTSSTRNVRLYYITQVHSGPPLFVVSANRPSDVHFSYQRYVINQIRKRFGFEGCPVRIAYRSKRQREPE